MNLFKKKTNFANFFGLENNQEEEISIEDSLTEEKVSKPSDKQSYNQNAFEEKETSFSNGSSTNQYINKKVVDMNTYQNNGDRVRQAENKLVHPKVTVFEPRGYSDCKNMAQALFRKEIVIITFSGMEEYQARRVVDFMTGTIYAVDGDIQRIGEEIFICTPASVDVDSSVAQSLISAHLTNY